MNAAEAKKLTEQNLKGSVIEPHLKHIYSLIEEAARQGKSSIEDPIDSIGPLSGLHSATRRALRDHLRGEGYRFEHVPDADPGDPRSRSYNLLKW